MLHEKRGGFFVGIGELDSATSDTILFEKARGWDGLLVEADATAYVAVKQHDRKCWTALCAEDTKPPCHSLTSMLNDLGKKHVDLFSLRLGSNSLVFLQHAFEWEKVSVAIWAIYGQAQKADIAALLHQKGYATQSEHGDATVYVHPENVKKLPTTLLSQYIPTFPNQVTEVVINIGSNTDPIASPNRGLCLVFEPVCASHASSRHRLAENRTACALRAGCLRRGRSRSQAQRCKERRHDDRDSG
jgi:hypothetical protein